MSDDQATPVPSPSVLPARFARQEWRDELAKEIEQIRAEMRELKRRQ